MRIEADVKKWCMGQRERMSEGVDTKSSLHQEAFYTHKLLHQDDSTPRRFFNQENF